MRYNVAKTIGLNTDQQAAQTTSVQLDSDNGFLAVLDLTSDDAFTRGRAFLAELQDFFLEEDGTPAEKLSKIFEKAKEQLVDTERFSILLAAISGKVLYLISQGDVEGYLKRNNTFTSLLNGGDGQLISGFLEPGDRVLLTTKSLTSVLGDDLKKSLSLSLTDWEEEITSRISNPSLGGDDVEPTGGLSGLLLEVDSEVEENEQHSSLPTNESLVNEDQPTPSPVEKPSDMDIPVSPSQTESSLAFIDNTSSQPKIFHRILSLFKNARLAIPSGRRGRLILAGFLIAILVISLGVQFKSSRDRERKTQVEALMVQAREDLNSASGLKTLNPTEANNKLASAKDKINQALALDSKNSAVLELKKQVESEETNIAGKFESSQFDTFLDLDLIKTGFKAKHLSLGSGKLAILDPDSKSLVFFDMAKKSHTILGGKEQLGNVEAVSVYDGAVFVYSSDKGIIRVDGGNQKVTVVTKNDNEWGSIADLYAFGGNVYALDSGQNKIWKYLPTNDGYSDKREYLTSDTATNFSGAVRMQIESSVYVLKQDGQMLRFTKGVADTFSYSGLDKGVKNPKSFYVSSDTEELYLLDSGNSRLLVLSKTGEFKKQYQGEKFANATDVIVDEEAKKAYLLEGSKIYSINLN